MSPNPWFKFYGGEFLSDPKIASLSAQERSVWITLLSLASVSSTPGVVEFLTVEVLLEKSGIPFDPYKPEEWNAALAVLEKFVKMKMITKNIEDSSIVVNNWSKRQDMALTNAERQKRYRERNEKVTNSVTKVTLEESREEKKEGVLASPNSSPSEITRVNTTTEGEEKPPKKEKYARRGSPTWELREELYSLLEADTGHKPTAHMGDYMQIDAALKAGLSEKDVVEMFEEAIADGGVRTVREVFTARKIDIYKQDNL